MSIKLAYTREEAAAAVGLSEDTIKKAINSGHLRAKRSGRVGDDPDADGAGKYLIKHSELEAWFDGLADA